MSNRVLIEIVGQDQGLDEANAKLDTLSQKEKQILADMKALEQERNKAKAYATTAEQMAAAEQKFGKMVEDNVKKLKEVRKEQDASRKSIEALSNAQKAMPGKIIAENTAKSFRTLKREIDEQLRTWSDWSAAGTEAYNKLMAKAGEMNDTMGDTNRMIQYMGSDTKGFDTLVDGTQAIAGGFSVAQGAMALFGSESEDLQLMMVKLQSAIAISTGLQQIGNVVQKESNLMMGIAVMQNKAKATAELLSTKTTIGATIAQKAFNLAAKANPYVLLAIALITVVGALVAFTSGSNKAKKEQEKLNFEIGSTATQIKKIQDNSDFDVAIGEAAGKSKEALFKLRLEAARTANDLAYLKMKQVLANKDATKEQRDNAIQMEQETYDKVKSILNEFTIYDTTKRTEAENDRQEKAKERLQKIKDDQQKEFDALRDYYTKVNEARIQDQTDAEKIAQTKIPITEEDEVEVKDYIDVLQNKYNLGLISYDDYLKKKKKYLILSGKDLDAINEEIYKNEADKIAELAELQKSTYADFYGELKNLYSSYSEFISEGETSRIQKQLDELTKYYTTDVEEARNNKDLKYISEKEYAKKEEELQNQMKQAEKKGKRANILINSAESIAKVIMKAMEVKAAAVLNPALLATLPFVYGQIPLITGAALLQIATLNKYWKGRKSGNGEMAMVGEYGPELMWIPQGAGIMPAHDTQKALNGDSKVFEKWNMPAIDRWIPLPDISQKVNNEISRKESIDYDLLASKIGEHVGRRVKIPRGKNVTVNVDNTGVTVEENNTRTRILNKKYNG